MIAAASIAHVKEKVSEVSFEAKKESLVTEEQINHFLDSIIALRAHLKKRTEKLNEIVDLIDQVTWIDGPLSDDNLRDIHDIISKLQDYFSSLSKLLHRLKKIENNNIAGKEINSFRLAIQDVREAYQDLESIYFHLPHMDDFIEAEKMISLL